MKDNLKIMTTVLIVVVGIGAFYYFGEKPGYVQALILLVSAFAALVIFYQTPTGKAAWEFTKGARAELRKVVWPSQKETMQVTVIVFFMAVLVAIFLWIVDWGLHKILKSVTG